MNLMGHTASDVSDRVPVAGVLSINQGYFVLREIGKKDARNWQLKNRSLH